MIGHDFLFFFNHAAASVSWKNGDWNDFSHHFYVNFCLWVMSHNQWTAYSKTFILVEIVSFGVILQLSHRKISKVYANIYFLWENKHSEFSIILLSFLSAVKVDPNKCLVLIGKCREHLYDFSAYLPQSSHRCSFAVVLSAFFHTTLPSALLCFSLCRHFWVATSAFAGFLPPVLFSTLASICFPAPFITNRSAVVPRSYDSRRVPLS